MPLRQLLMLSVEFEAMADMIARLRALDNRDDSVLREKLQQIEDDLNGTRLYMQETAEMRKTGAKLLSKQYPSHRIQP